DNAKRPPGSEMDPLPPSEYGRIQVIDNLKPWLFFGQPVVDGSDDRQALRVEQPVRNKADYALNVQYRFEYFDQQRKMLTPADTGWKFLTLEPRLDYRMTGVSPDKEAAEWRLVVRPAR